MIEKPEAAGLLAEWARRGVSESVARQLLASIPEEQSVIDEIEWGDYLIQTSRPGTFRNPAGFYVYLLRNGILPTREFETSRIRAIRTAEAALRPTASVRKLELENEYAEYRLQRIERAREEAYPGELLQTRIAELKSEICSQTPEASQPASGAAGGIRITEIERGDSAELPLLSFDEFMAQRVAQPPLFQEPNT